MNLNKDWDLIEGVTKSKFTTSFRDNRGIYNEIFNLKSDSAYEFKQLSIVTFAENIDAFKSKVLIRLFILLLFKSDFVLFDLFSKSLIIFNPCFRVLSSFTTPQ